MAEQAEKPQVEETDNVLAEAIAGNENLNSLPNEAPEANEEVKDKEEEDEEEEGKLLEYILARIDDTESKIEKAQEKLDQQVTQNKAVAKYEEQVAVLKSRLESHSKDPSDFDSIEMTLLDINAAKIKAEKEAEQVKAQLTKKQMEVEGMARELVKVKKQNETLEKVVLDLQNKLDAKDRENASYEATMKKMKREMDLLRKMGGKAPVRAVPAPAQNDFEREDEGEDFAKGAADDEFWSSQEPKMGPDTDLGDMNLNLWINSPEKRAEIKKDPKGKPVRSSKMEASQKSLGMGRKK